MIGLYDGPYGVRLQFPILGTYIMYSGYVQMNLHL